MKLLPTLVCAFTVAASALAAGATEPFDKLTPADGDTMVFLGDSITAQCLYTQYVENYFFTRYPHLRLHFHNAGVSGDTAADALERFDRDVAACKPKHVFVLLGMNDGASNQFETALFDAYRADMQKLVTRIQSIGASPLLLSPTMYDARMALKSGKPDRRGRGGYYNGVLALYGSWLREFAADSGVGFVDMHGPLNQFTLQQRKKNADFTLIPDGIHPDANGQIIMAYLLASDLGLSKRCSTITITRGKSGDADAKVLGGKVTEAAYTTTGLEFTFHPVSLPLAVPEEGAAGAHLIPLGHRLSYEALYLHGLEPGDYRMFINDAEVGTYDAADLASKVEIEENAKTPQYQQAVRVAALNAKRHQESVVPLRELWRARKSALRTRAELAAAPDDDLIKRRLAAQEKKLENFDADIARLDAIGKTIEDEIYRANQPQPLRFRLVRVAGRN